MNIGIFKENIQRSLFASFKKQIEIMFATNQDMKTLAFAEFDNFLIFVGRKSGKIINYLTEEQNENKVVSANTSNFKFSFIIYPDKSCSIEIGYYQSSSRKLDSGYLMSKVKSLNTNGYVYFIKSQYGYKIGCTGDLKKRVNSLGILFPFKTELHSIVECKNYNKIESLLHSHFSDKRLNGEWFSLSEEDFIPIDKLLNNIGLKRTKEL